MTTNEALDKQIEELMVTPQVSKRLASWLKQAKQTRSFIDANRKTFHKWEPLKFYVTLGCRKAFSIRYNGQEVATLACSPGVCPMVKISTEQKERNLNYFQLLCENQEFNWRGTEGTRFRKHFGNITNNFKIHSAEHRIESGLVAGLTARAKIGSNLRNRTAVTLADFPLQFPVPLSACKGKIGTTTGHLDILGRKRPGILSVWELKRPGGDCKSVVRQAYIYALQIYFMINEPDSGKEWLDLFKIASESKDVKMEIVIGISKKDTKQVKVDISTLQAEMKADGIGRLFSWSIANYNSDLASDIDAHKTEFIAIS